MQSITPKLKFRAKTLTVSKMILIQALGAAISGLMPFVIARELGSQYLADILYQYSVFVLAYSVASFGIPEQIQVMRSGGGGGGWLIKSIVSAMIFVVTGWLLVLITGGLIGTVLIVLFCINFLLVESSSRIINQEGRVLMGQVVLTGLPVGFWLSSYFIRSDATINLVIISGIIAVLSGLYSVLLLSSSKMAVIEDRTSFSKSGAAKAHVNRVTAAALDNGPIIVLYTALEMSSVVVMYAFITRVIMPISLILQSVLAVYLREKLSMTNHNIHINPYYKYSAPWFGAILISIIYYSLPETAFLIFDIPKAAIDIIFLMCLYRLAVLVFNLQNSWNIEKLNKLNWRSVFSPLLFLTASLGLFISFFPNPLILFCSLSLIVIFYTVSFGCKFSNGYRLV